MEPDRIERRLKRIVATELGEDEANIVAEASLEGGLDADSLDVINIVIECEDQFHLEIPDEDIGRFASIGSAIAYLEERLGVRA